MMDQMHTPLVSVIMPAYNAEMYIEESISSVLNQTFDNWELIVVDDCSSDRTYEIAVRQSLSDSRICVFRNSVNCGVAKTRNFAIQKSSGDIIAFIDSDDIWYPEKLKKQLEKMNLTNSGIVYCSYEIINKNGTKSRADYLVPDQVEYLDLLKENCIQCSAMFICAYILKNIRFNTDFYHEDYILGLDILKAGYKSAGCTDVLLKWRYIENSRSFNKKKSAKNRWRIYKDYLRLPYAKCIYYFICYTVAGLRKYLRKN